MWQWLIGFSYKEFSSSTSSSFISFIGFCDDQIESNHQHHDLGLITNHNWSCWGGHQYNSSSISNEQFQVSCIDIHDFALKSRHFFEINQQNPKIV